LIVDVIFFHPGRRNTFSFNGKNNSSENSYYHLHPELVINGSESNIPAAVIFLNCTEHKAK
jgi:hypothetical protein